MLFHSADAHGHCMDVDLPAPQAREVLEEEVSRYTNHICDLRSRINSLAPVSVLHSEILCEIFLRAARGVNDYEGRHWRSKYGWISISHVCRHWRSVALSCSVLWSELHLPHASHEFLQELLVRSGTAPLTVTYLKWETSGWGGHAVTAPTSLEQVAMAMILGSYHLERVRSLSLTFGHTGHDEILRLLNGPAPLLESLDITCVSMSDISSDAYDCVHQFIHHPETRRLRRLELYNLTMRWSTIVLPQLTHLNIRSEGRFTLLVDVEELMSSITYMNNLEELVINNALKPKPFDMSTVSNTFALPRLHTLSIQEGCSNCVHLLNRLEVPSLLYLNLGVSHFSGSIRSWLTQYRRRH
ncbi:hypothetical protein DAEQUDRAFT_67943 [Daedalea quercina L-15889]|uniref:Uncharacterized protein n=1 Tax=Daedalea quercina L-15889 TaxID=1314783 RepID=A0A165L7D2_9APHY|nr:hypothetical protein DAEQUDRAFT_67943 [Daedalea quercina L-15889]